ncbi:MULTISPECIES: phosphoglycerate kinase [unclassified Candidatus Frackibacter]|jgi:phosphoglycerate kinase|uniref:phosphoglycerate kinase n=1 Tax=unclassified Candidatus Frackibacter TaxID=2648818 RepID=UPI00079C3EB9|nr:MULTISPECIES: phosphoglycerate kinase [unclassified Candidatus Frackibacter]KXS43307.1 MAG: 3-phosphoglycerate kinase [Candidatus Frackibacter sp. T328-2]SDC70308.1 phosphoglycerate kinase [Candidatus Frackibacter sp. WG11]SFL94422.1 phosphoglycerate kinase [Candidatus Frackibacter sp. WG13]
MAKKILKDVKVQNKQVLVRVDFNVPMEDGKVTDDTRIRAALPTIEYLIKEDAKVILMAHLGRPGGEPKADLRLDPVAKELANLLNKTVYKTDETVGAEAKKAISQMEDGDVVLLENTRFNPGEKKNDPEFAKQLGELADIYVNDAFGATHRAHASTAGVTKYVDEAVMGFLIQNELETMGQAIENPDKPFVAIIGGAKVSGKIGVIETFLDKVDALLIGGGMANTFLAAKGYETGDSLVEEEKIDLAKELIEKAEEKGVNLSLPVDVMVADDFTADAAQKIVSANEIEPGWQALDIGPETIKSFAEVIKDAQTVVWNGPMGVFEMDPFAKGTTEVARALAESNATTIIGGGDSAAAVKKAGLDDQMTHISTGGGASLQFMEGKPLQAVEALDNKE